jgi:hypothetical protein
MTRSTAHLTRAQASAAAVLHDRCRLTRDSEGVADDVLDPTTLELTPPALDASTIYEGQCLVADLSNLTRQAPDVRDALAHRYRVRLPASAPEPRVGDRFVALSAALDAALVGKTMVVVDIVLASLLVTRQIIVELPIGARP